MPVKLGFDQVIVEEQNSTHSALTSLFNLRG
jgi:hypothetical protein